MKNDKNIVGFGNIINVGTGNLRSPMSLLWQQTFNIDIHQAQFLVEHHFQIPIHSIRELYLGWQNRVFLINEERVFHFPKQGSETILMEKEILIVPYIQCYVHFLMFAPILDRFTFFMLFSLFCWLSQNSGCADLEGI